MAVTDDNRRNLDLIRQKLTTAVNGTDTLYFTESCLDKFAEYYNNHQTCDDDNDANTTLQDSITDSFLSFWWDTPYVCRRCSVCGRLMIEGYCYNMGDAYYCSNDCLNKDFTIEEWLTECEENEQSYYTEWR